MGYVWSRWPCVRLESEELHYPVSLAARYGASVEKETRDFERVYARFEPSRRERPSYWPSFSVA